MTKVIELGLAHIDIDGETQNREKLNEETVNEYAEAIEGGEKFPPMTIYKDGSNNWLVDGFHRYFAYKKAGITRIKCEVHNGTLTDARIASLAVNTKHGLRRTNADKRKAVSRAFELMPDSSERDIAKHCGVSHTLVSKLRKNWEEKLNCNDCDRGGNVASNTVISKTNQSEKSQTEPDPVAAAMEAIRNGEKSIDNDYDPFSDPDIDEYGEKIPEKTLDEAVSDATVVYDNKDKVKPEGELSFDEWIETLPIWRILSKERHAGIRLRADLEGYKNLEDHLKKFKYFVPRCFTTPLDTSPLQQVINTVYKLTPPDQWKVCAPCKGGGCRKCDGTGYDLIAGIDPKKIENDRR